MALCCNFTIRSLSKHSLFSTFINYSWRKTLKAHDKPNACVQVPDTMYPGFSGAEMWNPNTLISEDCLYLNIAVPSPRPNNSAVLVYITQYI